MAYNFSYRAKKQNGESVQSKIEATDIEAAKKELRNQGLEVESIHLVFGSSAAPAGTQPVVPKVPPKPVAPKIVPKQPTTPQPQQTSPGPAEQFKKGPGLDTSSTYLPKPLFQLMMGLGIVALVFAFMTLPRSCSGQKPINKNIVFQVAKIDDLSEDTITRKNYSVTVPRGISEEEVKYVAQKIYAREKKQDQNLSEAMLDFFYQGADLMVHAPVAVIRWNWQGSGQWEYSFSFDRAQAEDKVDIQQTGLEAGREVRFKITLSNNITVDGARKIVGLRLFELSRAWREKVKRIKAICIYEDFFDPFMMCEMDLEKEESLKNIDCEYIKN